MGLPRRSLYVPSLDLGAVVLRNAAGRAPGPMANQLVHAMMGRQVTPISEIVSHPITAAQLRACTGTYRTPVGDVLLEVVDGGLRRKVNGPGAGAVFSLLFQREEKETLIFFDPGLLSEVTFTLGPAGGAEMRAAAFSFLQGKRL